ncbi:MAG: alpha/beta hydrolase [Porphyromonadaceae bacterium]|nr:MAG: alpha/beta hydrolase [Porphyromonadaceae bacterium]
MKSKLLKRGLWGLLIIVIFGCLLMVTPRIWSALNPNKPPLGYHFVAPAYLAIGIGLEELVNKTPDIPEDIEEIKNIEYKRIDGKSLQLDIYIPKNIRKPAPLLVFIHGGGWKGGNRSDYLIYLVDFAKRGYITATVSYRLLEDAPYPACAEDITDAVRWFYSNGEKYGYDPDRIALIGGSAGAHLALLASYGWKRSAVNGDTTEVPENNHRIKAVVDIYGPVDLTTEYARTQPLVTSFIAHSFEEAPELYREASPINYLDKNDPPTMILHGTSDELVPISQSDLLKARLDSLGVPNAYYRVPLWPHTMDIVKRVNDFSQLKMNDFFEKYLK